MKQLMVNFRNLNKDKHRHHHGPDGVTLISLLLPRFCCFVVICFNCARSFFFFTFYIKFSFTVANSVFFSNGFDIE